MAAKKFDISMLGNKELSRKLNKLEPALQKKVILPSLRRGAKLVLSAARANVTVVTGKKSFAIRQGLTIKGFKGKKRSRNRVSVDVRSPTREELTSLLGPGVGKDVLTSQYYYPAHVELGTKKTRALPFLRPAVKSKSRQVTGGLATDISTNIAKVIKTL